MSGYLSDILEEQRERTPGAEIWRGQIAKTMSTVEAKVPVTIPAYAPALQLPVKCRWQPRVFPLMINDSGIDAEDILICRIIWPQRGDPCLVAFDENEDPWVVLYWSYD